jgi:GNAT superfamily N-acetyltransferase
MLLFTFYAAFWAFTGSTLNTSAPRVRPPKVDPARLEFRRLCAECARDKFDCGEIELDSYFKVRALIEQEALYSRTITVHLDGDYATPVGLYCMTIWSEPEDWFTGVSPWFSTKVRRRSLLTVHLRWVAVIRDCQRYGIGALLMGRAIDDFYHVTNRTGIAALTLKPISNAAESFYRKLGFEPYDNGQRMFLSAETVIPLKENGYAYGVIRARASLGRNRGGIISTYCRMWCQRYNRRQNGRCVLACSP